MRLTEIRKIATAATRTRATAPPISTTLSASRLVPLSELSEPLSPSEPSVTAGGALSSRKPPPQAGGRSIPSLYFTFTLNHDKRENNFRNTLPPLQSTPSCSSEDATAPSPHSSGPHPCALPDFSRLTHGFTFRLGPARRPSVMARPRRCCSCSPSAAFGRRSFLFRSLFPLLPSCFL